jgi:hypothetical protein
MDRRQFLAGLTALAATKTVRAATGPVSKDCGMTRHGRSESSWRPHFAGRKQP